MNGETWFPSLVKGLNFKSTEPIQKTEFATQLVRDRKRWFACIPVIEEVETKELDKVIALDPGVRTFSSESIAIAYDLFVQKRTA